MIHALKRIYFYVCWPGLVIYFARGTRSRVAIIDASGRLLLVRGKWKGWYDDDGLALPGGGMHKGEQPVVGAVRELREELGLTVADTDLQLLGQERITEYGISYGAYIYKLNIDATMPLTLQASEIVSADWYAPSELREQRLKPDVRQALQLLVVP